MNKITQKSLSLTCVCVSIHNLRYFAAFDYLQIWRRKSDFIYAYTWRQRYFTVVLIYKKKTLSILPSYLLFRMILLWLQPSLEIWYKDDCNSYWNFPILNLPATFSFFDCLCILAHPTTDIKKLRGQKQGSVTHLSFNTLSNNVA